MEKGSMVAAMLLKAFFSLALLGFLSLLIRVYTVLWLKPQKLRSMLVKQGIKGPPPTFLVGNILEMRRIQGNKPKVVMPSVMEEVLHNYGPTLYPCFDKWRKEYGNNFTYSLANAQILYVTDPVMANDMCVCTSLVLGKPAYLQRELGHLLGDGILSSNGAIWSHQRKTIAQELTVEKVKGMASLMVECTSTLVKSWESRFQSDGEIVEIKADEDLRRLSSHIISKALFGTTLSIGLEIISRLKAIQNILATPSILRLPGYKYMPTETNKKVRRLAQEVHTRISNLVQNRTEDSPETDLLQMIIKGANKGELGTYTAEKFILDNCKNVYFAGLETTAVSTVWCFVLLALHPEWQDRIRAEVNEICGGCPPDAEQLRKMKTLTMVIQEVLRFYPPAFLMSREAMQEIKLGDVVVPKGVIIWLPIQTLHRDPEIWGPDADKFNPERFANGVVGACKYPQTYLAFGVGPRVCVGQNFATMELKIILSQVISKFSFSLSPKYHHSPVFEVILQPKHGVTLLVKKV